MNGFMIGKSHGFSPVVLLCFDKAASRFFATFFVLAAFLFPQNEARAAVAFGSAGAVAAGTTALDVPHPAGIVAGNLLVLVVGNKFSPDNPPATPVGWTLVGQGAGGLGNTNTNDQGPVFSTIFVNEAVGGESGNLVVSLPGANSSMGRMFRYTKAAGTVWDYAATSGSDDIAGTAWSVTGAADPGITVGDMLIVGSATNTDQYTYSAESVAATGAAFGVHTGLQDSGTGNGRDMRLVVSDHTVTAGTATAAPVFTMTASATAANRPTGASVILRIREIPAITTLATGTDPAAATIPPGAVVTDANQFTLQTSSGTEAITSVTVNLSTNNGVDRLAITDNAGTELGFTATPVTGSNTITVTGMSATTILTTFKVRVTPLSHAAMPVPPGSAYAITAPVTAWAGPNTHAGSDTNPNALTIDNLSPDGATATGGTAGDSQVTLNWTTSASADLSRSVMLRWTGGAAGAEVPAEGTDYAVDGTIGTATVACVRTADAASTAISGVDGTGVGGCSATALTSGQAYTYKIFQKDTNGNYDTGAAVGAFTPTGLGGNVINTYYPGTASVLAGATSITLGAATGAITPIAIGDLLLIMQMQDATIDSTNTASYGTVSAANAGLYEYAIAASAVPLGGGTLSLLPCGIINAYTNANYVAGSSGQRRFQVIRVPVQASATLNSTLTALAWNGSTGGVLAFDVTGALNLNSATVTVDGKGFRGGAVRTLTGGVGVNTDYRTLATVSNNGSKGEGIAGTPYYLFTAPGALTNTGVEGYPNGSHARGAPANGGGGGTDRNPAANDQNPGGGGGANGGAGGAGGIGWCPTFNAAAPPLYGCGPNSGGLGGNPVTGLGATRLTLGGGGGGGTANNITGSGACAAVNGLCSSGAAGGGIIMLRAGSMTGAAIFNANGSAGDSTVGNDGSGGGGAGGAVLIKSGSGMGGATINVNGGNGGSNLIPPLSSGPHGPGGGGGGGYVITSGAPAASSTASGASGVTYNAGVLFGAYGATAGSAGSSNLGLTSTVGVALGATACGPSGPDHYTISHSGTGITCEAEPVIFTAHDNSHVRADANGKTINISTNTGSGTWLAASDSCTRMCYDTAGTAQACVNGFSNTIGNNGTASYTFAAGESGIRLCLKQNSAITQNINVSDGIASETSGTAPAEGGAGANPNLVFSDTGIRIYADGNVDSIANQVAGVRNDDAVNYPGTTQTLTVRALKSGETTPARCVPLLTSVTRTLQFAYRCDSSPSTCSASLPQGLEINGTAVSGFNAASTPVPNDNISVNFDANGYGSINLKYFDVGNISLWARATSLADSTTGSTFAVVVGNSNTFVVKPYDFEVIACTSAAPCTTANTSPADGTGSIFAKAGETFKATVTARAFGGLKAYSFGRCDGSGGTGCTAASEAVILSQILAAPGGGSSGTLGGTPSANASAFVADTGAYTFTDLNWNEVGVITLKAGNANYLLNGFGACTTQTAGEKCQGTFGISGNIGRFIPDHFDTVVIATATVPMPCPTGLTGLTCPALYNGFIYSGQPFSVQVTARNLAGGTTANYDGVLGFSKAVTLTAWDALGGAAQNPGNGVLGSNAVAAAAFGSGVATLTDTPAYTFDASPAAPTDIYVRATDTDGVTSLRATPVEGGVKVASGRVKIGNAYGSELLQLPMSATVQYYDGTQWSTSLTDSVTSLTLGLSNYQCKTGCAWTTAPIPASGQVIAGILSFQLSQPSGGGTGSVDASINAPDYLLAGSNGAGANPSKAGRATFGVYKGNREFIYLREAY